MPIRGSVLGMQYSVQIVGDDELPKGVHKVIVEREDGAALLLINGELARCWRFMREWEGSHESCGVPSVLRPAEPLLRAV